MSCNKSYAWIPSCEISCRLEKKDAYVRTGSNKIKKATIIKIRHGKGSSVRVHYESEGSRLYKDYEGDVITHFALR